MTSASGAGGRRSRDAILDGPLRPVLFRLAWPIIGTSLVNELQGFISTLWLGRLLGEVGLAALAVMNPTFVVVGLISGIVPVGVQVLAARSAGRDDGRALRVMINGVYLGLAWALALALVCIIALAPITRALAGKLDIAQELAGYLRLWLTFYPMPVVAGVAIFAVSATGWTRFGLIQSLVSIGLLVVLMPVFLGVLHLGLPGVALSDGCSDAILFGLTGYALLKYRSQLGLGASRRGDWQLEIKTWGQIANTGVPYQAARAMDMIAQVVLVRVMMETGDKAVVGGYGVAMLLINIAASAASCLGIAGGIVIGQNAGAGKPERASACLRVVVLSLTLIGLAIVALASFPEPVVRVFTDKEKIVAEASAAIGLLRWAMPAALLNNALLRAYTAVSPNRIGNALSIVCASLTMMLAELGTGSVLARVAIAMIAGQYLRLILLAVMYRRAFRLPLERARSQVL